MKQQWADYFDTLKAKAELVTMATDVCRGSGLNGLISVPDLQPFGQQ
jgi:hypothetical protein